VGERRGVAGRHVGGPFIGVYLTVGSFTNFDANFAKAFTGSSVTADLFMTPAPLAATGGIGLLLGLFGVRGRGYRGRGVGLSVM